VDGAGFGSCCLIGELPYGESTRAGRVQALGPLFARRCLWLAAHGASGEGSLTEPRRGPHPSAPLAPAYPPPLNLPPRARARPVCEPACEKPYTCVGHGLCKPPPPAPVPSPKPTPIPSPPVSAIPCPSAPPSPVPCECPPPPSPVPCEPPLPAPAASFTFDECNATAGGLKGDAAGRAVAYLGKHASLERCANGGGCAARFDLAADCCADGYAPCWGTSMPGCSDWDGGAVATLRGPPGGAFARMSASTLVFDGLRSLSVSVWVKPAVNKVATITGRTWDFPQFAVATGVAGTWDTTSAAFFVAVECAPCDRACPPQWGMGFDAHGGYVPLGEWTHVVGVFGAGAVRVYVDGALVGGPVELPPAYAAAGLKALGAGSPIFVGGHPAWAVLEGGLVDCVSYYREALSDADVAALHRRERGSCGCRG
jgi:hypothetical protein